MARRGTALLDSVLKDVKLLKNDGKEHVIGISGGGSSRRPRSIKDCRARGRRRSRNQLPRVLMEV
jgi:hypothetical protein